jgi:hypothetical protein
MTMPDISLHDAVLLAVLFITLIALMYVAHRMDCRAQRRIEDEERREAADRVARLFALRRAYNLDRGLPKEPGHTANLAPGMRPHPLRKRHADASGPWVIPPASMAEPSRMESISTTDTPDGDAQASAAITTYSPEH